MKSCVSCGRSTNNQTEFPCPNCGQPIIRCRECRMRVTRYKCPNCGWEGP